MKTARDPRHRKRRETVKELFALSFSDQKMGEITQQILARREAIDKQVAAAAPAWPIDKINRIDLAILRLAIFEIENAEVPSKVVIDEAVELAKEYGSESSPAFVNGVLGNIMRKLEGKETEVIKTDDYN